MSLSIQESFSPRIERGTLEFPIHYMRGGTSTGVVIHAPLVPDDESLREELIRHIMGVPLEGTSSGNKQITGLGRGPATSNKVFLADVEPHGNDVRLVSTLAQLAADKSDIDWSVNCGNMSAALPFWALDTGLAEPANGSGTFEIPIFNTNTSVTMDARVRYSRDGTFAASEIPGVNGAFPGVDLILRNPAGAKTGSLLPTGNATDTIGDYKVSCVDVAVPMVIVRAAELGKTAYEPISELDADDAFKSALRTIWVEAGLRMRLKTRAGTLMTAEQLAKSETVPKICIIGEPRDSGHLSVRYFTPQTGHASLAVTGGCCLAACALVPGSVAEGIARDITHLTADESEVEVALENPAGILQTSITGSRLPDGSIGIKSAAYKRSAQILMRGHMPLYRASKALTEAVMTA